MSQLAQVNLQQKNALSKFSFTPFQLDSVETITDYFDRLELQLNLCNVPAENWASQPRVFMGCEVNASLINLAYPTAVSSLSFQHIKEFLIAHHEKPRNKFSEAIHFRSILQKQDEPIQEFVSRLKAAARHCKFGDFLDYSITVQFIHGVSRDDIRDDIIAAEPATFDAAVKLATSMQASRDAAILVKPSLPTSNNASTPTIHKFSQIGKAHV